MQCFRLPVRLLQPGSDTAVLFLEAGKLGIALHADAEPIQFLFEEGFVFILGEDVEEGIGADIGDRAAQYISTLWLRPSSSSFMAFPSPCSSSIFHLEAELSVTCKRVMRYSDFPYRYTSEIEGQSSGKQGLNCKIRSCLSSPTKESSINWYIHPAEPVYQVQPPMPLWDSFA